MSNPTDTYQFVFTDALKGMINLNTSAPSSLPVSTSSSSSEPIWKILVFDRTGQDIISPLLSVKELRELGVTLHVLINNDRDAIPDVPVIYFVLPSEENIKRICQDFKNQLYDSFYLNFITPISRTKLDTLAQTAFQANVTANICKIFDQYSNFVSLEDELFVLKEHDKDSINYYAINRGDVDEDQMDKVMNDIVDGLFSVFVTLGVVPVIRCPKGNAAEMVSLKLEKRLRENLQDSRNNLFVGDNIDLLMPRPRPLLVILDRNMDMATPLHHTWTYQALAHDVLNLKLNRLRIDEAVDGDQTNGARSKTKPKTYDLSSTDKFWNQHRGSPFPQVAESVQEELETYRNSEEEVKRLKLAMGLDANDEAVSLLTDTTAKLNSAVSSLPELIEKKKKVDMHTTIATSILDQIKTRKLDIYFETEEKILSRASSASSFAAIIQEALDFISNPGSGHPVDKIRLFLILMLCDSSGFLSQTEAKKFEAALEEAGCDLRPLQYMKRWKTFSKIPTSLSAASNMYGGGTKTVSMFSKLMSQGSQFVMEGVKNLVVKKHVLPFTRITDALMDHKNSQEVEDYHYLDPKTKKADPKTLVPFSLTPFQEVSINS
jgi:3D (Asp-Asp-Asp) domain-containing protein